MQAAASSLESQTPLSFLLLRLRLLLPPSEIMLPLLVVLFLLHFRALLPRFLSLARQQRRRRAPPGPKPPPSPFRSSPSAGSIEEAAAAAAARAPRASGASPSSPPRRKQAPRRARRGKTRRRGRGGACGLRRAAAAGAAATARARLLQRQRPSGSPRRHLLALPPQRRDPLPSFLPVLLLFVFLAGGAQRPGERPCWPRRAR